MKKGKLIAKQTNRWDGLDNVIKKDKKKRELNTAYIEEQQQSVLAWKIFNNISGHKKVT